MSADARRHTLHPSTAASIDPAAPALRAICWGTRGSIPSPGPATVRFGGNTPCLEVGTRNGHRLIFDAGTGIRVLGRRLAASGEPVRAELFLTHFHWDHIQGMPFFAPLHDPRTRLRIFGAPQNGRDIRQLFAAQLEPTHFPVPYDALSATFEFEHLDPTAPWELDGVRVRAMRMRHAGVTCGFRIDFGGAALAYIPDNELVGADYPVEAGWYARLVEFLDGVDLLFHDAMFTDAEYRHRVGWGHSTYRQAIALAEEAGVPRLFFFHHAPDRSDDELEAILREQGEDVARRGSSLVLAAAMEGEEVAVAGTPAPKTTEPRPRP